MVSATLLTTPTSPTLPPGLAALGQESSNPQQGLTTLGGATDLGLFSWTIGGGHHHGSFVSGSGSGTAGVGASSLVPLVIGAQTTVGGSTSDLFNFSTGHASGSGIFTTQNFLGTGGFGGAALTTLTSLLNANLSVGGTTTELDVNKLAGNPLTGFGHHGPQG